MKITHVHQTFVEKPLSACPHCGKIIFRSRWVVDIDGKRTVLCEDCVNAVRRETDKIFMKRIREILNESKDVFEGGKGRSQRDQDDRREYRTNAR